MKNNRIKHQTAQEKLKNQFFEEMQLEIFFTASVNPTDCNIQKRTPGIFLHEQFHGID